MSEILNQKNLISISIEIPPDIETLRELIEPLYLKGGIYNLIFSSEQMTQIQSTFDEIIACHGILSSEFNFLSRETLSSHDERAVTHVRNEKFNRD